MIKNKWNIQIRKHKEDRMNRKRALRLLLVAATAAAIAIAVTYTAKVIAEDWHGKIGAAQVEKLDPDECVGGGSGGECYGEPPECDPNTECCPE